MIDTNVWVSRLLLANSLPARAVDKALDEHDVVVSEASMEELADVLSRGKFDKYVPREDRVDFVRRVLQVATMVPVLSEIGDCRDPKDNRILALALDSGSECVISGDRDLVTLSPCLRGASPSRSPAEGSWRAIAIVTPGAFEAWLERR